MRVALISSGSGSRGGGEIYLCLLAQGLKDLGHTVIALIPEAQRMDELSAQMAPIADVRRFPFVATYERKARCLGAMLDRRQQSQLQSLITETQADIIHVNQQVSEDGLDLLLAADRAETPWVSTIHVGWGAVQLGAQFGRARDIVSNRTLRRLNGVHIAVSGASQVQLQQRLRLDDDYIRVALNGVLSHPPDVFSAARTAARSDWQVDDDQEVVVGAVGRIEAQKDPIAFIDYFAAAASAEAPIRLVWIGDGSMRGALERHASNYADRLSLTVDGWREDAGQRLAGFDIFALPSKFEGLPLALLEAMHAGLPVIANDADGIAEAITSQETGYLCASPEDWNHAAKELISRPEVRARVGAAARAKARANFSIASMAKATEEIYRHQLANHQQRNAKA